MQTKGCHVGVVVVAVVVVSVASPHLCLPRTTVAPQNKKLDADLRASILTSESRRVDVEKKAEELSGTKLKLQVSQTLGLLV